MKPNIRICSLAMGLALMGLTGCETTVETTPAVTTTTQTTETTEVRRPAATVRETHVVHED